MDSTDSLRLRARRRALRAAQLVTLTLSLAGAACGGTATTTDSGTDGAVSADSGSHDSGGGDATITDSGGTDSGATDSGGDATIADAGGGDSSVTDAGNADAGDVDAALADLGATDPCMDPSTTCGPADGKCPGASCSVSTDPDCCTCIGGFPGTGGGCAIAGPFVPPAMA